MGRLHDDPPSSSSHSLHTLPDDDLPPPYTDEPEFNFTSIPDNSPNYAPLRLIDSAYILPGAKGTTICDTRASTLEPRLSNNSAELFSVILGQSRLPPRPLLRVQGTHTESSGDGKKKSSNKVTDFFFQLDLAETLLTGWDGNHANVNWREVEVIKDGDDIPAYRGSRLRTREYKVPALRGLSISADDTDAALLGAEVGIVLNEDGNSVTQSLINEDLKLWCERYCNDPAPLKS